jgi:hypothetical protein
MSQADTAPDLGPLRLITLTTEAQKRRHVARRRIRAEFAIERRRSDRRRTPGIDGLLRTVLAGDWM